MSNLIIPTEVPSSAGNAEDNLHREPERKGKGYADPVKHPAYTGFSVSFRPDLSDPIQRSRKLRAFHINEAFPVENELLNDF